MKGPIKRTILQGELRGKMNHGNKAKTSKGAKTRKGRVRFRGEKKIQGQKVVKQHPSGEGLTPI